MGDKSDEPEFVEEIENVVALDAPGDVVAVVVTGSPGARDSELRT